jgi:hypothetical protein
MFFRVSFASFTYIALVFGDPVQHDTLASSNVRSMRSVNVKPSGDIEAPLDGLVRKAKKKDIVEARARAKDPIRHR